MTRRNPYDSAWQHQSLLEDESRSGAYQAALLDLCEHGFHALDLGCGIGILSFMASRAGCERVYALDRSDIIEDAREAARRNKLDRIVEFHRGDFSDIKLPGRVDLIIQEQIGCLLWDEDMVGKVAAARRRWLKPGGLILPDVVDLYLVPCCYESKLEQGMSFWREARYGFDFSGLARRHWEEQAWRGSHPLIIELSDKRSYLTEPRKVHRVDLNEDEALPGDIHVEFPLTAGARLTGLLGFMGVRFPSGHSFSTGPRPGHNNFGQMFFPFLEPLRVEKNSVARCTLRPAIEVDAFRWDVRISNG